MRGTWLALAAVIAAILLGTGAARDAATAQSTVAAAPAHSTAPPHNVGPVPTPGTMDPCPNAQPVPAELKLPAVVPPGEPKDIELKLLAYLSTYKYQHLGWCVDKYVRDTGPYVHSQSYGSHPAVRIYYSPEVMRWLRNGRVGVPDDGAVIIKEQYYKLPAAAFNGLPESQLKPQDWTFMIRRSSASRDGWFWGEVYPGLPFGQAQYPNAGFGLYCLRCHGSANDATTFASTRNIKGFPGDPISFRVDNSWRTPPPWAAPSPTPLPETDANHPKNALHPTLTSHHLGLPLVIRPFPPEPLDGNLANPSPQPPPQFFTSDQCMSCHSAASGGAVGPTMWLTPPPSYVPPSPPPANAPPVGVNVSEYGEWRWSPMGLAGRDPVFFSQLEYELRFIDTIPANRIAGHDPAATRAILHQQVVDTCMRCHGVMGKRTNDIENGRNAHFNVNWVFQAAPHPGPSPDAGFRYGGLARDGISCTVCHHINQTHDQAVSLAYVLNNNSTGLFTVGSPEELNGPFKNDPIPAHGLNPGWGIAQHPMNASLGAKPVFSALTQSARLCTTCHSINLPVVDKPALIHPITQSSTHDVEQNTYVEWVNSRFQTEYKPLSGAQSCQDCHMPVKVDNDRLNVHQPQIQTQIAVVQDQTSPEADHLAPIDTIFVRYREGNPPPANAVVTGTPPVDRWKFRRHELLGLNAFLLRAFQRNSDILGVRLNDYMSSSVTDLPDAIDNAVRQGRQATAKVDLSVQPGNGMLVAKVSVLNKAGHRFPSGVGFRRAFVELKVTAPDGTVVWASGTTNPNGEIVNAATNSVLPTEYFTRLHGVQMYQPHFDEAHPITDPSQVQIFEELVQDAQRNFTFSFIRRDHHVKDNRLLPQGWRKDGVPGIPLPKNWLDATHPEGVNVTTDPRYANGEGKAVVTYQITPPTAYDVSQLRVQASLYYQAWEPAFRKDRSSGGIAANTLNVILSNMGLAGTKMDSWKLLIDTKSWAGVAGTPSAAPSATASPAPH